MWTAADRVLVGDYGSGQALSDDQYRLLEQFIPPAKPGGRPRRPDMRRLLDGLFYVVRTGCQWRHLPPPPAFRGPPSTATSVPSRWRVGEYAPSSRCDAAGEPRPGSQSHGSHHRHPEHQDDGKRGPRGYDAAKRVNGRKRHIAVDTQGLLLGVIVHAADAQDADSAGDLLKRLKPLYCWLKVVFADSIY